MIYTADHIVEPFERPDTTNFSKASLSTLQSNLYLYFFCFIKQVLIPWSINQNPNRNLDKSIGILIGTWTNQLESRNPNNQCPCGHSTVCTRSERAQSCRHQRFNCGHIYSKSRPKLTAHKKSSSGAEPRT